MTIGQQFEQERMVRTIDGTNDVVALRTMAKQLLRAWYSQKAMTLLAMRQNLGAPSLIAAAAAREQMAESDPVPPWDDPLM